MKNKIIVFIIGGALILALAAGFAAFFAIRDVQAKQDLVSKESQDFFDPFGREKLPAPGLAHDYNKGGPRQSWFDSEPETSEFLAQALGISVEKLQAARQAALEKVLQQLVKDGEITQAQADRLKDLGFKKWAQRREPGLWWAQNIKLDFDAFLAAELGVSLDDLHTAQQKASDAALQAAVEAGKIGKEQADLIRARQALQPYLDRDVLVAKVLGIEVAQLQSKLEEGATLRDLATAQDMNMIEFQKSLLTEVQKAVEQAVKDEIITQEQADELLFQGHFGAFGICDLFRTNGFSLERRNIPGR